MTTVTDIVAMPRGPRPTTTQDRMPKADRAGLAGTSRFCLRKGCGGLHDSLPPSFPGTTEEGGWPTSDPSLESDLDLWGCQLLDGISPVSRT